MAIRPHLPLDERLSLLRAADGFRKWRSLDDRRFCILCERTFTGRQVRITRQGGGRFQVHCPDEECHAGPNHWVRPGNPLISDTVYRDWWRALGGEEETSVTNPTVYKHARHA